MDENKVSLKEHLEDKMDRLEEKIDGRIDALETKMDEKFEAFGENMILRLQNIQEKVDLTYTQALKTNGRVNKHDTKLEEIDKKHYKCPGSEALDKAEKIDKDAIAGLKKRMDETDKAIDIFKFASSHPKLIKAILVGFIGLILMIGTKISINTLPDLLKLFGL